MHAHEGCGHFRSWHLADLGVLANVRFAPIVLKKSKIEGLRKSRECRMLMISAAARLCRIDASVDGRFCVNRCGPSHRSAWDARAVL